MKTEYLLLVPVFFPMLCGAAAAAFRLGRRRRTLNVFTVAVTALTLAAVVAVKLLGGSLTLIRISPAVELTLAADGTAGFFSLLGASAWLLASVYACRYMIHEEAPGRFFSLWLVCLGAVLGADLAGNAVSLYLFYELVTLSSFPLVLHDGTPEAVNAGMKYLFYSVAGAFLALFGIAALFAAGGGGAFAPGGSVPAEVLAARRPLLLAAAACMLMGFGVKCGLFPLHGWLPTAHPAAPAPASALLSGVITKVGVLASLRTVFFLFGPDFLRGTWVQTAWLSLICFTIFLGSMMAWREKLLKKRLAWSTVSQVSYVLLGLALLTPEGLAGALWHAAAHAGIKSGLFFFAGAVIFASGRTRTDELSGAGKALPGVFGLFVPLAAALVGIPPAAAFTSKWRLATAAIASEIPVFGWLGPVVLLVSALLTAAYLFPLFVDGFFPGRGAPAVPVRDRPGALMLAPLAVTAAACLLLGLFPGALDALAGAAAGLVFGR